LTKRLKRPTDPIRMGNRRMKISPAIAAGVTSKLWETSDMVAVLEAGEMASAQKENKNGNA